MSDEEVPKAVVTKPDPDTVVAELAKLSPLEYDKRRDAAAEQLSVRVSTLDKVVAAERSGGHENEVVEPLEPWPDPVDGADLAD